jgi:hypothetical protein
MKTRITLIFGLPGSGKTTLGRAMYERAPLETLFLDDLALNPKMIEEFDPNIHRHIIIADPMLCETTEMNARRLCKKWWPGQEFKFKTIYFENNPEACTINALRDPKPGGTTNMIKILTKVYFIHPDGDIRPVYKESLDT